MHKMSEKCCFGDKGSIFFYLKTSTPTIDLQEGTSISKLFRLGLLMRIAVNCNFAHAYFITKSFGS